MSVKFSTIMDFSETLKQSVVFRFQTKPMEESS